MFSGICPEGLIFLFFQVQGVGAQDPLGPERGGGAESP